jgi:galactitol-specific phosphotransferase system IIB component
MPLNKSALELAIKDLLTKEKAKTDDSSTSIDNIASKLAEAIDIFVRSGFVTTTVATTGSASAQTGTGTGYIS